VRLLVLIGLIFLPFVGLPQIQVYRTFHDSDMVWLVWLIAIDSTQEYSIYCGGVETVLVQKNTVKTWISDNCPVDSQLIISTHYHTWTVRPSIKEPLSDLIPLKKDFSPALASPNQLYVEIKPQGDSVKIIIVKNEKDSIVQPIYSDFSFAIPIDTDLVSVRIILDEGDRQFVRSWHRNLESFFDTVDAEMLFHYANALLLLTEEGILKEYLEKGDTFAVRQFMKEVWRGNMNMFWEFKRRVDFALKEFSTRTEPGYATDRGMVLLKYGFPDQRFVKNMEPGVLPYEIWIYRQLKGFHNVRFVFYNPYIASNYYELIHSTFPGEVFNPYWERYVVQGDKSPSYWSPDRTRGRSYFGKQIRDYYEFYAPGD